MNLFYHSRISAQAFLIYTYTLIGEVSPEITYKFMKIENEQ